MSPGPSSDPKPRGHACVGNLILGVTLLAAIAAGILVYFPSAWPFAWPFRAAAAAFAEPFPPNAPLVSCPAPVSGAAPAVDRNHPFVNGLGMEFVPVPWEGGARLFSRWETRMLDYATYAKAARGVDGSWQETAGLGQDPTHPVVRVDWQDARNFCAWLTESERRAGRLAAGWEYRLPTDAEWSAAAGLARETDQWVYGDALPGPMVWPWGPQWPPPRNAGNYRADRSNTPRKNGWGWVNPYDGRTAPVGSYPPNGYGLFDLGGNASEWVDDERPVPSDPLFRIMRGGNWNSPRPPPSSYRDVAPIGLRNTYNGFRTVIAPTRR